MILNVQRPSPRAYRKALAAISTQYGIHLPPAFFGYGEDGKNDPQAYTSISISASHRGLHLLAVGCTACRILQDYAGGIHSALIRVSGAMVSMHDRSGEHELGQLPFAKRYFLRSLMVGSSKSSGFWQRAADAVKAGSTWEVEADRKLPRTIGRGLLHQAVMLLEDGDDVEGSLAAFVGRQPPSPEEAPQFLKDAGLEFGRRLDIRINSVKGHSYAASGPGPFKVVLQGIEFTCKAELGGPWVVGRNKIEADGLIYPSTRAWAQDRAAA